MRFFSDDPSKITEVQWYFVGEKGPWLGRSYSFGSLVWDRAEQPQPSIGEVYDPHPWTSGKPPYCIVPGGVCGSEQQWTQGALSTDPVPPYYPGTLIPTCCSGRCPTEIGGTAIGGTATATEHTVFNVGGNANGGIVTTENLSCTYCTPPFPMTIPVTLSGFAAPHTGLNGLWNVVYQSLCVWNITVGPYSVIVEIIGGSPTPQVLVVAHESGFGFAEFSEVTGWDCHSLLVPPVLTSGGYSGPIRAQLY